MDCGHQLRLKLNWVLIFTGLWKLYWSIVQIDSNNGSFKTFNVCVQVMTIQGPQRGRGWGAKPPLPTFWMVKKYFVFLNHIHHLQRQLTLHINI